MSQFPLLEVRNHIQSTIFSVYMPLKTSYRFQKIKQEGCFFGLSVSKIERRSDAKRFPLTANKGDSFAQSGPPILKYGSEAQKDHYLPRIRGPRLPWAVSPEEQPGPIAALTMNEPERGKPALGR